MTVKTISENRRKYTVVATVVLLFAIIFSLLGSFKPVEVMADDSVDAVINVESNAIYSTIATEGNNSVGGTQILTYTTASGKSILKFSNAKYAKLDHDEKVTFMETVLKAIVKSGLSASEKNKTYNFIAEQDTAITAAMKYLSMNATADFVKARKWFLPFNSIFGTIMGVLCILIFMSISLSILIDVMYLSLPAVKAVLTRDDNKSRPFLTSVEAWKAAEEAEQSDRYKSALGLYLKKRVILIVIVGIALSYLISGKIYDIIIYVMDAFS